MVSIPQALQLAANNIDAGLLQPAEDILREILQLAPENANALYLMGILAHRSGKAKTAIQLIDHAIQINQTAPHFHAARGEISRQLNRVDEAIQYAERAIALSPDEAVFHSNLGIAFFDQKDYVQAEKCQRQALRLKPDLVQALNNLGSIRSEMGDMEGAVQYFKKVLAISPDHFEALNNLGLTLIQLGQLEDAEIVCRRALQIRPNSAENHSNLLFTLSHSPEITAQDLLNAHREFGKHFNSHHPARTLHHPNNRNPQRPLKIGFVSGDLRMHAVAHFIAPVWQQLDRSQLSIVAYSTYSGADAQTHKLKALTDQWIDASSLSDEDLDARIRHDGIDILFDLSGHTAHNRLTVFARKPSPIQITWIGYPGTTGLDAMDYRISDPYRIPPGMETQFVEKIARLPSSGTFTNLIAPPPVSALPGLSRGHLTFGCFQRPCKLGPATLSLWSKVLKAIPDAQILFGGMNNPSTKNRLLATFSAEGISPSRLIFHPQLSMEKYLSLHQEIDILLDTFPFPGGTTTNHGLLMGVPTLTMAGKTAASLQGAAIMTRMGLQDWVAQDETAFVALAQHWADNLPVLSGLRANLRHQFLSSPLNRPETVARGLEAALRIMWRRWCAGLPPEHLQIVI